MTYNFDQRIERRGTGSVKWEWYGEDVLPLWVADMDFASPAPVIEALQRRVEHGIFGYDFDPKALKILIQERLARLYQWEIEPEQIIFLPGVVSAFNVVNRAIGEAGDAVLMQPPVYPPFLSAPGNFGKTAAYAELDCMVDGQLLHYYINFEAFEAAITPRTRLFMLCNPHNPVGRVFTRDELARLAAICDRHNLMICSDEIHCDLLLDDHRHTPIASLSSEIAQRTIALMAPSKTFNIPGLACSFAIVPNADMLKRMQAAAVGTGHVSALGFTAAIAAYRDGQPWLDELLAYLTANRDYLTAYVQAHFPNVPLTHPEGTYLSWLDWRAVALPDTPFKFFLEQAKVALFAGEPFGPGGAGFVRLNFACPRSLLEEALERMRAAITQAVG
ncbi:MAG: putative C-S lyase [Chloroflexi bacterium]|nr:putative C-S lyase [Chloroflexota bacterium]